MQLFDAMKPAMDWSEAAMLPAQPRTLSGGAALRQLRRLSGLDTASAENADPPVPSQEALSSRDLRLGRAAYHQVRRMDHRTNSCVTYTKP